MAGFASWFGFSGGSGDESLPEIFPLSMVQGDFVTIDVMNIYAKILTDVVERTQGIPKEAEPSLWDNCLASEKSDGLVTLLAKAMANKSELFLVYDKTSKVLRKATSDEESKIREDYKKSASSTTGTYISFKNYTRTDMVRLYSALEYCTVGALSKSMNLSKAVQMKLKNLRGSTAAIDAGDVKAQAVKIANGLKEGKDVMLDSEDILENAKPDLTAAQSSMELISQKQSFYLGMPASYITGEAPKGLGDTGEGDAKAVERGLNGYFTSIIKPVVEALFGGKCEFKSEDFRMLSSALEVLKTFELTSEQFITADNKLGIVNKIFGFPADTKGGEKPPEPTLTKPDPNAPPAKDPPPPAKK